MLGSKSNPVEVHPQDNYEKVTLLMLHPARVISVCVASSFYQEMADSQHTTTPLRHYDILWDFFM